MQKTLQRGAAGLAALAATAAGGAVPAHAGPRAELETPFTTTAPGSPTGLRLLARYLNPDDRAAKPPAISRVAIALPEGTVIDPNALPVCQATDEEIRARGRDACPPESKIGEGKLVADTGVGGPVPNDLGLYNGPGQIVEIVTLEGTNTTSGIDRLRVEGRRLVGAPPFIPGGPPDGRTAVREIRWDVPPHGRYLVTPPACRPGVPWHSEGDFGFADGGATVVGFDQTCTPRTAGGGGGEVPPDDRGVEQRGRMRLVVSRRPLVQGRTRRLRVRVVSPVARCRRGVAIAATERGTSTNRRGRATLAVVVKRARSVRVRARKEGCGRVVVTLRVRRR